MTNNTVLITGGNSGIGFECALYMAKKGWQVIIASRNKDASKKAVEQIKAQSENKNISYMELDLASCQSVRKFAKEIETKDIGLNALICNGAIQMDKTLSLSPEGFEVTFAVNHLGHFLLTNLLLKRLISNNARIVVVASGVHDPKLFTGMPKPHFPDIETLAKTGGSEKGSYNGQLAYVNSKLCNILFAYELVRRIQTAKLVKKNQSITINSFDPGLVPGSGLARDYPFILRFIWENILPTIASLISPIVAGVNPAWKSGEALANLVLDPKLEKVSGKYFPSHTRWQEAPSSEASYDLKLASDLWEQSIKMTSLTAKESPLV